MTFHTIILTTGISSLNGRNLAGAALRRIGSPVSFPEGAFQPDLSMISPTEEDEFLQEVEGFLTEALSGQVVDPARSSAECSVLASLQKEGRLGEASIAVLVHLPTLKDRLAATCVSSMLGLMGIEAVREEVTVPFDPAAEGGLAFASGAFLHRIAGLLRSYPPQTTAFAPIGGYKVMVSLGYLAASIEGYSCLYQHEDSRVLQKISPVPLALETEEVQATLGPLARKIGSAAAWDELPHEERQIIKSYPNFFSREGDLVGLNEFGHYLRLNALPVRISSQVKDQFGRYPELAKRHLCQVRDLVAQNPAHRSLNKRFKQGRQTQYRWRLAALGDGHRMAWQLRDDELLVHHLFMNHDGYDGADTASVLEQALPAENIEYQPF